MPIKPFPQNRRGRLASASELNRLQMEAVRRARVVGVGDGTILINDGPDGLQVVDGRAEPIWAKILSGTNPYAWEEVRRQTDGSFVTLEGGRTGTTAVSPAYEVNDNTEVDVGVHVRLWLDTTGVHYWFEHCCTGQSGSGSGDGAGGGGSGLSIAFSLVSDVRCVNNILNVYRRQLTFTAGRLTALGNEVFFRTAGCCDCSNNDVILTIINQELYFFNEVTQQFVLISCCEGVLSGSGSGDALVPVDCCPGNPIPATLYATLEIAGACACAATMTITLLYNPATGRWVGTANFGSCGFSITFEFWCLASGDFDGQITWSNGCAIGASLVQISKECDPLAVGFLFESVPLACDCAGDIAGIVVTE